ncbi:hypothetical protein M422DRAFT_182735 [Sphaerobolus stellatus SS14]|uniref:Unplaced genomic scaffold SPHSTscaffold_131, whole genome shotgun sequence n=1 Tax=Sphaerobolus stellatus (strain SS14) TaxID=990650 RepID=A0A0C9UX78_SPHS4|nr:hypothetical protein M422DRAFT_182735 [Sphaerobolus stellatus SS14]
MGWKQASSTASKGSGYGLGFARSLRLWVWEYLEDHTSLPMPQYGTTKSKIDDEDFSREIQLHLQSLGKKYFSAMDIVHYLSQSEVKARLKLEKAPSERTARKWLKRMEFHYGTGKNGMYIDGHEHEDVVNYRQNTFLPLWYSTIEPHMVHWTSDGKELPPSLPDFPLNKRVVLVTHDESTFYANDRRKLRWIHKSEKPEPVQKGEGTSIMVSDFCSPDLGWLRSKNGETEARILFKAGKSRDGYFSCEDLCQQIELAIELFEDHFPGTAIAAFGFGNAPGHQKRADDALSARYMPKYPKKWTGKKGIRMQNGILPNGQQQEFYYPDNHPESGGCFKGMKKILEERGLTREANLNAECDKFKCPDPNAACCCRRVLFNQPDFIAQKPAISHGHIAFFYPKFHCELNFIEQCWGYAKFQYRMLPWTKKEAEMEKNIRESLDKVDTEKMRRFASRSARFMDAYQRGLTGSQAAWANKKYHGHRVLPNSILEDLEKARIAS